MTGFRYYLRNYDWTGWRLWIKLAAIGRAATARFTSSGRLYMNHRCCYCRTLLIMIIYTLVPTVVWNKIITIFVVRAEVYNNNISPEITAIGVMEKIKKKNKNTSVGRHTHNIQLEYYNIYPPAELRFIQLSFIYDTRVLSLLYGPVRI